MKTETAIALCGVFIFLMFLLGLVAGTLIANGSGDRFTETDQFVQHCLETERYSRDECLFLAQRLDE